MKKYIIYVLILSACSISEDQTPKTTHYSTTHTDPITGYTDIVRHYPRSDSALNSFSIVDEGTAFGYNFPELLVLMFNDRQAQKYEPKPTDMLNADEKAYLAQLPYGDIRITQFNAGHNVSFTANEKKAVVNILAIIRYVFNASDFADRWIDEDTENKLFVYGKLIDENSNYIFPTYKRLNKARFIRITQRTSFNITFTKQAHLNGANAQIHLGIGFYSPALPDELQDILLKTTGRNSGYGLEIAGNKYPTIDLPAMSTVFHELLHAYGYPHPDKFDSEITDIVYLLEFNFFNAFDHTKRVENNKVVELIPDKKYDKIRAIYEKMYADMIN